MIRPGSPGPPPVPQLGHLAPIHLGVSDDPNLTVALGRGQIRKFGFQSLNGGQRALQ